MNDMGVGGVRDGHVENVRESLKQVHQGKYFPFSLAKIRNLGG